eukprot:TRINITY_DN17062_c0_g2_i2.p1 TRINITY_DN17062_c0_g2~~TRINITY_DN17062_c0_g2_i2.p1  ORF type:complete len:444 (-),score=26.01 TRINITY_DN17062_c0_g2_i2:155-1486(-)
MAATRRILSFLALVCAVPNAYSSEPAAASCSESPDGKMCQTHAEDADGSSMLQILHDQEAPPQNKSTREKGVSYGTMLSQKEWETKYDFVVKVWVQTNTGHWQACTGTMWGKKVLFAQHCLENYDGSKVEASALLIEGPHMQSTAKVVQLDNSPGYYGRNHLWGGRDFAIATVSTSHGEKLMNNKKVVLRNYRLHSGRTLQIPGFGQTVSGDGNPPFPERPVVSRQMTTCMCPQRQNVPVDCVTTRHNSKGYACAGDSGGPWLQWRNLDCDTFPKWRDCPIHEGNGARVQAYNDLKKKEFTRRFIDGTGLWCSVTHSNKQTLEEAMEFCLSGYFQGNGVKLEAPCTGIVFRAPQPGNEGHEYTTCWKEAEVGLGWQALLKPVLEGTTIPNVPVPQVAEIAGVHSLGPPPGQCFDHGTNAYGPPSEVHDWIEEVAPGHFLWVDK